MSDADRWASQLVGAAMTVYGVRHFRRGGWILAGFGLLLFRRGYSGHCHTYDLFGVRTGPEASVDLSPTYGDRSTDHNS
jgi:hypothetical protein